MSKVVVTDSDVESFQARLLGEMQSVPELYHPKDVEMMRTNSEICRRYLRHKRGDQDAALDMAKKSLQWRHEFGVNGLTENNIYRLYLNIGCFIPFKTDKENSQCVVFRAKLHRKNAARSEDMKRYMIFWVEKFLYEQNHPRITFVFDCTDASYSSTDLDQVMFMIQIFNELYPWALGYVIVYNMPWILKTVWLGIRALIPADGADRFKFCNGNEIFTYIDRENLPQFMGGCVPTPFRELTPDEIEAVPVDPDIEKRIGSTPEIMEFYRQNFGLFADSAPSNCSSDHSEVFVCNPDSNLTFETKNNARVASLDVTNCLKDGRSLAFKIRTNRPDDYDAHPHYGIIAPGATTQISITRLKQPSPMSRGKFLVQVIPVSDPRPQVMYLLENSQRNRIHEKVILCEAPLDDDYEADSNGPQTPAGAASSIERWVKGLESYHRSSFNFNILVCVLLTLNLAVALHSTVCRSENSWWFC